MKNKKNSFSNLNYVYKNFSKYIKLQIKNKFFDRKLLNL